MSEKGVKVGAVAVAMVLMAVASFIIAFGLLTKKVDVTVKAIFFVWEFANITLWCAGFGYITRVIKED